MVSETKQEHSDKWIGTMRDLSADGWKKSGSMTKDDVMISPDGKIALRILEDGSMQDIGSLEFTNAGAYKAETTPKSEVDLKDSKEDKVTHDIVEKEWNNTQIALIKSMTARNATIDEFRLFLYQAKKYKLDPLAGEIWCIKYSEKDPASIFASHSGIMRRVVESGYFDGMQTTITWASGGTVRKNAQDLPMIATATVWRKGISHPMVFDAYYASFVGYRSDGKPKKLWATMPEVMLRKCAVSNALRELFPDVLGAIYTPEEMPGQDE